MQTLPKPPSKSQENSVDTLVDNPLFDTTIHRRKTRPVKVGDITIGGIAPVVVQSMINEDTMDIDGSVAAIRRLHEIGCEIVRVTVPSISHARALGDIRAKLEDTYQPVPLVADVHHNGMKIALEVVKHVDKVRIEIIDTGRGIAPEHIERIFERFYRVDPDRSRKSGGTGLGLVVTKKIVEEHGGEIGVQSKLKKGTTFTVTLPTEFDREPAATHSPF